MLAHHQPQRAFNLDGEVALVTGAGSRMPGKLFQRPKAFPSIRLKDCPAGEIGNGRVTAILLAREGAKVVLVDYNVEWAQDTKRMIDAEGGVSAVVHANVTEEESCRSAVAKTVELFGALHILVNIGQSPNLTGRSSANHAAAVGVGGAMEDAKKVDLAA